MTASPVSLSRRFANIIRQPILRRSLASLLALVILIGLFGYLLLPGIIQSQAQQLVSAKLHRTVSIGKVEVHPFALAVTVHDFTMLEPHGDKVFASFETLTVNLSSESLWRLAPVVQAARLDKPYVHLVRTAAHQYNIDDLLAPEEKKPAADNGPGRFSLNNLQLVGGRIEFEDMPAGDHHAIEALDIGVPFISTLPSQVDIFVEPLLAAKVNGTPLLLKGKAKPFAVNREATLELNLDGLDLTRFVEYLPFKPAFKLAHAKLDTRLAASFTQPHGQAPALTLSGKLDIKSLRLVEPGTGKTFLALPELNVNLDRTSMLSKQFDVARVTLNGLEMEVSRSPDGQVNLQRMLTTTPIASLPDSSGPEVARSVPAVQTVPISGRGTAQGNSRAASVFFKLGELDVGNATLRYTDQLPAGPLFAGVEKMSATVRGVAVDTGLKRISIASVTSGVANIKIRHDKPQTSTSMASGSPIATGTADASAEPAAVDAASMVAASLPIPAKTGNPVAGKDGAAYVFNIGRVAIDNWSVRVEDRSQMQMATSTLAPIKLSVMNLSNAPSSRGRIALKAIANRNGQLVLDGTLGLSPLHADLQLDLQEVDLLPLQPYVTDRINLLLSRASLSGKGALQFDQDAEGSLRGGFKGDATLANFATVDKQSGSDFLRWKSLYFGGVDARLQPFALAIDQVALSDFFARIIIDPSGRINLQDIVRNHANDSKSLTEERKRVAALGASQPTAVSMSMSSGGKPVSAGTGPVVGVQPGAGESKVPPVRIGKLTLQGGRVRFTDNFVKPNYTANLMDLGGAITGLSSDADTSATVDLRGHVNSAPLTVAGRINPLKGDLSMDLQAKVRDMELAPLSPYSGRYVGYGIEKGKLSFDVAYKVDQRRLTSENRLILDQLTLGDKVENPDAASLPVHLAVALLRDRNGVIDLNLPVEGSLDDPQFSIRAIIGKVIVNAVSKAVTAPFTLLGSLFGGGGAELSYLEFIPGRAAIPAEGEVKLKSLAKALTERPGLKLEITAHTGTEAEIEGMKRAAIQRKVRALKLKNMEQRGEAIPDSGVEVKPEEYPGLLARVYKDEKFPKPRNVIGLQKDLSVGEMEKLMMANTEIDEDDLAALGNRRAQAVKDWLLKNGQIPGERIYILATRTETAAAKAEKGPSASRVDFSLK